MSQLTYYRQQRQDGGVRTGIELDGTTFWHAFEAGATDDNPALLWFVDVRCEGRRLPATQDEARDWFIEHSGVITQGLADFEKSLEIGFDQDVKPIMWQVQDAPEGNTITIVVSAIRRITARNIVSVLSEMQLNWIQLIEKLQALTPSH